MQAYTRRVPADLPACPVPGHPAAVGAGAVILTVTLNATLQVSYEATEISWGAANHIRQLTSRAGGGGLAVARVLAGLGEDVLAAGFAGGGAAQVIEADLARAGVATAFTRIARESRRVVDVLDEAREEITRLAEPAPFITTGELGRFAAEYRKLLPGMEAVVLSGGLPAGLPGDVYASLTSYAAEAGVPAIVHAGGPVLWQSLARHPALVLAASTAGPPGAGVSVQPGRPGGPGRVRRGPGLGGRAAHRGRPRAAVAGRPGRLPRPVPVRGGGSRLQGCCPRWPRTGPGRMPCGMRSRSVPATDPAGEMDLDAYEVFSSEVSVTAEA